MTRPCPKDPRLCARAAGRSQSQLDMGDRSSISSQRARVELPSAKRLMSCFHSAGTNQKAPACVFILHKVLPAVLPLTSGNVRAAGNPLLCWLCCFNNYGSQSRARSARLPRQRSTAQVTPAGAGEAANTSPASPGPRAWPARCFLPPEQRSPACFHPEAQ